MTRPRRETVVPTTDDERDSHLHSQPLCRLRLSAEKITSWDYSR